MRYGDVVAVRGVDLDLAAGEVTALMGRNGSGKSSLLWAIQGSGKRQSGIVDVGGSDPKTLSAARARARSSVSCPQTPADLLYLETVRAELRPGRRRIARLVVAAGARAARPARARVSPTRCTRATSRRGNGSRSCSPCNCAPRRRSCCSTSRPAGSTTKPSARSCGSSTGSQPKAGPWSSRPTTSSSSRPRPIGSS